MIWFPSSENATEEIVPVCPCSSLNSSPVLASHTRTDLSLEPETIRSLSGENATEVTVPMPRRWLSNSPPTILLPSEENAQSNNSVEGIVSNGIVIVPIGSEIDGINPNRFLQFLQIDES